MLSRTLELSGQWFLKIKKKEKKKSGRWFKGETELEQLRKLTLEYCMCQNVVRDMALLHETVIDKLLSPTLVAMHRQLQNILGNNPNEIQMNSLSYIYI